MDRRATVAAFLILAMDTRVKKRNRRLWVRKWIARRSDKGAFHSLLNELRVEDPEQYRNFVRMTKTDIEDLLNIIGPTISRQDTHMRAAIPPAERLIVTLRFLASGDSYASLQYLFRIPASTMSIFIPEVCAAIFERLKGEYLKVPTTVEEWRQIAHGYQEKWNFPQCLGSLDGKHIVMQAPANSGSYYYNYKGTHSIVLMALVDANYKIIFMDVGCNGRVADGGVFRNTSLSTRLEEGSLAVPPPSSLPGRNKDLPFVIVADDAFAMKPYLMKPYPHRNQPGPNRVFNYRLSRARRTVENVFGLLAARFRILRKPILLGPEKTERVTAAICTLHNFLLSRRGNGNRYVQQGDVDYENEETHEIEPGTWRRDGMPANNLLPLRVGNLHQSSQTAKEVRDEYRDYFLTAQGEVAWQYKYI